jgi:hypothetical protein
MKTYYIKSRTGEIRQIVSNLKVYIVPWLRFLRTDLISVKSLNSQGYRVIHDADPEESGIFPVLSSSNQWARVHEIISARYGGLKDVSRFSAFGCRAWVYLNAARREKGKHTPRVKKQYILDLSPKPARGHSSFQRGKHCGETVVNEPTTV